MRSPMLLLCVLLSQPPLGADGHNPLLPLPQQIHYGSGRLPIAGLEIGFAFSPTPQDRFAADELASGLLSRAKVTVQVSEGEARQRMVVLRRAGSGADLPQPNEQAGPDSREAYAVNVTSEGAEIRANSSAGLFYGVQTLLCFNWSRDRVPKPHFRKPKSAIGHPCLTAALWWT